MGLLAPWFLGGLAALSVPVFVHLLRKHVTTPRPVSSLMFFERGTQSSTRHRRLRYLLLFALRFALLLLVVLAFASPYIRHSKVDASGRLLLIVVDRSFSMSAGTRFADAKQQALNLLASKPAAQKAQIMALGSQLEIFTQPTADGNQLRSTVESIEPGYSHATFGELGHAVSNLGETVHGPIDLHLFSDMQRSAMPGNFADMALPENVSLLLHSVAPREVPPNWTVASVDAPTDLADPKDPRAARVKTVIAGFHTPAATKTISLVVNGKVIATHKVEIPANGRATVEFAPLAIEYGFNRCEVRIEPDDAVDGFPADDAAYFAVRRSDPQRVLFVHSANDLRSSLYFGAALAASSPGAFVVQSALVEQTTDIDPSKFAFVVLSDAETLPSLFEHTLEQYVTKGGSVFETLGTGVGGHRHIPLWKGEVKDAHSYARTSGAAAVGKIDFTHPAMYQAQPARGNGGWADTQFFYAAVVDPGKARVAASLSDGTPLLLDLQLGEGHVLLFTSGLENLTNDLPLHPIFVAFIDRTARYLSGKEDLGGSMPVDAFVQLRAPNQPAGEVASVEVIDSQGHRPLSLAQARTAQSLQVQLAGFYQLRLANGREAVVGVNPDRRESDLEPISPDIQQLWSGSSGNATAQSTASVQGPAKYERVSLWWYVILLAFLVALAETTVASGYLGTQREEA